MSGFGAFVSIVCASLNPEVHYTTTFSLELAGHCGDSGCEGVG